MFEVPYFKHRVLYVVCYSARVKSNDIFRFGTFETLKEYAVDSNGNLTPMWRLFCGFGAGERFIYLRSIYIDISTVS